MGLDRGRGVNGSARKKREPNGFRFLQLGDFLQKYVENPT